MQAWKAYILYRHLDEAHYQRGVAETLALCKLEPPITDGEALSILQETLDGVKTQAQPAHLLWEKAAKAKPQDEKLQRDWFWTTMSRNDWKGAQKVRHSGIV